MNINSQIEHKLRQLKLTGILETMSVRVKQAQESKAAYEEFLMMVVEDEYERRQSGKLLRKLKKAGFEEEKTLEGFDFSFEKIGTATVIFKKIGTATVIFIRGGREKTVRQ